MITELTRQDIIEKRQKCIICGYEMTTPEYINDDKCVFHTQKPPTMGLVRWICFSIAEYRVMRFKRLFHKRGLTQHDYIACMQHLGGDIGAVQTAGDMEKLCDELKNYKMIEVK